MQVEWLLCRFEELTVYQLYAVLQLRTEVFVVEQNCVFQDMDDKDQQSFHLLGYMGEKLVAYTRLVPDGLIYEQPSIGRVVTSPAYRSKGAGRELMVESIQRCIGLFGNKPIKIGAQFYLRNFYTSLGFEQISDIYLEDGIEHIYMLRKSNS